MGRFNLLDFLFGKAVDRRIASFQNSLMTRYIEEVENTYRQMRGWRHDYHNHIQMIKAFHDLGEDDKLNSYLMELASDLDKVDTVIKSGNVMVDAILNSKLSLAKSHDIAVNATALLPLKLHVSEIDLCIIIGNMLDNAIEACKKLEQEERFIRVYMDLKRESLYLCITNSSPGVVKRDGKYLTAKLGSHGFGLERVDKIIAKHDGYIKRSDEEGAFTAEMMLPN